MPRTTALSWLITRVGDPLPRTTALSWLITRVGVPLSLFAKLESGKKLVIFEGKITKNLAFLFPDSGKSWIFVFLRNLRPRRGAPSLYTLATSRPIEVSRRENSNARQKYGQQKPMGNPTKCAQPTRKKRYTGTGISFTKLVMTVLVIPGR